MKVEKQLLITHENLQEKGGKEIVISVPQTSIYLDAISLDSGIYLFFAVPELTMGDFDHHKFFIPVGADKSLPAGAEYKCLLTQSVHTPQGEGIMLYPLFKL